MATNERPILTVCPICNRSLRTQPDTENEWLQLFVPHVNYRTNRSCAGSETLARYSRQQTIA